MYKHEMVPLISSLQKIAEAKNLPSEDKVEMIREILSDTMSVLKDNEPNKGKTGKKS